MAKKSNNKVVLKSIILVRGGKRVQPPIGKAFPFEDEEIEQIERVNPSAIRDAVNEDEQADEAEIVGLKGAVTPRGAGKTTAIEGGTDGGATTTEQSGDSNKGKMPAKPAAKADDDL